MWQRHGAERGAEKGSEGGERTVSERKCKHEKEKNIMRDRERERKLDGESKQSQTATTAMGTSVMTRRAGETSSVS